MIKLTKTKLNYLKCRDKANKDLILFREKQEEELKKSPYYPDVAEMSMEFYESLLEFDYGLDRKPKLIGELFGIKVMIDPMLKRNEIVFRKNRRG